MCGCGGISNIANVSVRYTKPNTNGCRTLRKDMMNIKKKAYSRYKLEGDTSDLEVFNKITQDLRNFKYCPEQEVVTLYKNEYGL